ncbi:replication-relaxation family protein [Streptomyces sp. NPDC055089]
MRDLGALGFVDYGRHGREMVWHLTTLGQRTVVEGGDVVMRPHADTGERAIAASLAPHGLAVTDVIVQWGGSIIDWEVEVDHTIEVRRVVSDAVLYRSSRGAEVVFLEMDRFTMSISRLAMKLRTYEAYSRATYFEGQRGTIGSTKFLWRQRYPDSSSPSCAWSSSAPGPRRAGPAGRIPGAAGPRHRAAGRGRRAAPPHADAQHRVDLAADRPERRAGTGSPGRVTGVRPGSL